MNTKLQTQSINTNLKNQFVEFVTSSKSKADISMSALEAMRVSRNAISASKNGLEVICGASCETGAQ